MRGMQLPLAFVLAAFAQAQAPELGAQCIECHAEVVAEYRKTGKARSLRVPSAQELEGEGSVDDPASGLRYRFQVRDGVAEVVEEAHLAETGENVRVQSWPVAFAIGSGRQLRSFALRWGELLALAPIEELRADGQREAQLGSRHQIHPGARFTLPVDRECLSCHTSAPPPRSYPENLAPLSWTPRGIDCEGCHADAEAHAQSARAKNGKPALAGSTSCARCHADVVARLELPGCGARAQALFTGLERGNAAAFVDQAPRTPAPAGAAAPACTLCHRPHADLADPAEYSRARGAVQPWLESLRATCPRSADERGARACADCHLPLVEPVDVANVRIHDHASLLAPRAAPAREPLRAHASGDGRLVPTLIDASAPCPIGEDRALALIAYTRAESWSLAFAELESKPSASTAARGDYWRARSDLLERANKPDLAIEACERALACDPAEVPAALRLARLLRSRGKAKEALALLERCVQSHPQAEDALRARAELRAAAQDLAGFVRDLERAFAIAPRVETARVLAQAAGALEDPARAARWKELAQRLELTSR